MDEKLNEKQEDMKEREKVIVEEKLSELEILRQSLEEKKDLALKYYNQLLCLKAEFDNYRKRMEKEKTELIKFGNNDIVLQLIPILEDIEKAQAVIEEDKKIKHIIAGLKLIYNNLFAVLKKEGLKKQEVIGKIFDPNLHHAVMNVETDECEDNEILEELQKGYLLKDKVIRPAMVKVSKKATKNESNPPKAEQEQTSNN
jgi:molecular chaperone GrpE